MGVGVVGSGFGVRVGLEVWGSGFGVVWGLGLGFGVWGLVFFFEVLKPRIPNQVSQVNMCVLCCERSHAALNPTP